MTGIVVAPGLVLSPGVDGLNADSPVIGYRSLVTGGNVAATSEAAGSPASNLANPSTYLKWRAASAAEQCSGSSWHGLSGPRSFAIG